ncbi:MAG: TolC family protein [Bacteroidetes bacterium]|uniref:TolC family protein n=1 Tax=Candidatus Cryptobacteroides excrementipullorum TaxID=2840761 RepID=A0A9D9IQY6_9BACT|nr:TolC family protein [Candidatus Cryptobacteroides excrementipullorum]
MRLTTLYNLADQQSQKIRVSEEALQAADEGVAAAKSALLPSVDLSLQGSYTGNAFMLSRGFSGNGTTDYIVPGVGTVPVANGKQDTPHWGNSFTAQVSQVIYAGGAVRSGIRMAELGKEMAELDVEKNRQEVRFLLTGYYLDLCKLDNQIEVVRQNIALTQKEIEQMKARRKEGTVLQNDITRYEFQLQSLKLTLTKLTDASTVINHQLVTTLHLPEQTIIVPDKNELDTEINALSAVTAQETWQQTAADNNLGIRQATVATNLAEQKMKQIKAESLPSVAVVAENQLYGPYTQDLIPKDCNVNVWFVGIGVKFSLGNLWKNKHNIRKARIEHRQSQEALALAHEEVENGVQASYTNLLTSCTEVKTQQKQVELANQNYSVVQNRYQNDLALLTDMVDASNMKLSAEMALVNARIGMLYNFYKLKYVTNTL